MPLKILVSAGEASGDLYASELVEALRDRFPDAVFFGCTGPRMRRAGVRQVVDSASLSVVGLVEVVAHIPRIYREFRKLVRAAEIGKQHELLIRKMLVHVPVDLVDRHHHLPHVSPIDARTIEVDAGLKREERNGAPECPFRDSIDRIDEHAEKSSSET